MQELVKRFLDEGLSRRGLIQKLSALGIGLAQARSLLEAFQARLGKVMRLLVPRRPGAAHAEEGGREHVVDRSL